MLTSVQISVSVYAPVILFSGVSWSRQAIMHTALQQQPKQYVVKLILPISMAKQFVLTLMLVSS